MAGTSFSLTEKLAVTGAFLALVAMVVGTEEDPGLVVAGQDAVKDMRSTPAVPEPALPPPPPEAASAAPPLLNPTPPQPLAPANPIAASAQAQQPAEPPAASAEADTPADVPGQFSPKLGRVPRDFSKGPPG